MADVENQEQVKVDTVHQLSDKDGYILDPTKVDIGQGLKLSPDRQTVLIPQPSGDPQDPLNWSQGRKNLILFIVSATALLADYGSATGAVTLVPQAAYVFQYVHLCTQTLFLLTWKTFRAWHMSEDNVNHSQVGNLFMLGAGGVIVVALAAYFGRLPVFFWFAVLAFATAAWCAGASSFDSFLAARIFNGLFSTVAQGVSFFRHYHELGYSANSLERAV